MTKFNHDTKHGPRLITSHGYNAERGVYMTLLVNLNRIKVYISKPQHTVKWMMHYTDPAVPATFPELAEEIEAVRMWQEHGCQHVPAKRVNTCGNPGCGACAWHQAGEPHLDADALALSGKPAISPLGSWPLYHHYLLFMCNNPKLHNAILGWTGSEDLHPALLDTLSPSEIAERRRLAALELRPRSSE